MERSTPHRIYLDHAATTPIDPRVLDVMINQLSANFGNASSLHTTGISARSVLEDSRREIAQSIDATPSEICFTSGGTEANNLALKGVAFANRHKGDHLIVSSVEHDCVLNTCQWLEEQGFRITYIPVDETARIDPARIASLVTPKTILVSVMYANNETGTIEPVAEIGTRCHEQGILFHTDACQAFGKIPIDVNRDHISLMTINSHKIYGPKGVGALYVRSGVNIEPILHGGGQEKGLRSTTENIPAIAGFACAARLCIEEMEQESVRQRNLKNQLIGYLSDRFDTFYINGDPALSLPGLLNFSFHGMEGEAIRLLLEMDDQGISVSAGSACSSNNQNNSSHVLLALGRNQFEARGAIRISLGRFTSKEDMETFTTVLSETAGSLKTIFSNP